MPLQISNYVHYFYTSDEKCESCENKVTQPKENQYLFDYPCDSTLFCSPFLVTLQPGKYRFELWGAQGGDSRYWNNITIRSDSGGKGAYVSGEIVFREYTTLYFYIGGRGEDQSEVEQFAFGHGGFNGGGNGGIDTYDEKEPESGAGGGGATDIRLIHHSQGGLASLKSRIAVASGGGGASSTPGERCKVHIDLSKPIQCSNKNIFKDFHGGPAGALFGYTYNDYTFPPNQSLGLFGRGSDRINISNYSGGSVAGSGGGYYGGKCISNDELGDNTIIEIGGSGGSSFISGHQGCNSVLESPIDQLIPSNSKYHYSGYTFRNTEMKSGLEHFKNQYGDDEEGHKDSGAILLSFISPINIYTYHQISYFHLITFTYIFLIKY